MPWDDLNKIAQQYGQRAYSPYTSDEVRKQEEYRRNTERLLKLQQSEGLGDLVPLGVLGAILGGGGGAGLRTASTLEMAGVNPTEDIGRMFMQAYSPSGDDTSLASTAYSRRKILDNIARGFAPKKVVSPAVEEFWNRKFGIQPEFKANRAQQEPIDFPTSYPGRAATFLSYIRPGKERTKQYLGGGGNSEGGGHEVITSYKPNNPFVQYDRQTHEPLRPKEKTQTSHEYVGPYEVRKFLGDKAAVDFNKALYKDDPVALYNDFYRHQGISRREFAAAYASSDRTSRLSELLGNSLAAKAGYDVGIVARGTPKYNYNTYEELPKATQTHTPTQVLDFSRDARRAYANKYIGSPQTVAKELEGKWREINESVQQSIPPGVGQKILDNLGKFFNVDKLGKTNPKAWPTPKNMANIYHDPTTGTTFTWDPAVAKYFDDEQGAYVEAAVLAAAKAQGTIKPGDLIK